MATLLSCCGKVTIQDEVWYGSMGRDGAAEFHTLSAANGQLNYADWISKWDDLSNPMICTDSKTFAEMKKEQEELCSNSGDCNEQVISSINAFYRKVIALKKAK